MKKINYGTSILKEKLTEYIKVADEKKVAAFYTLLEDKIEREYKWYEDEAFVAELEEDMRRIESSEEKAYTTEEVRSGIFEKLNKQVPAHV